MTKLATLTCLLLFPFGSAHAQWVLQTPIELIHVNPNGNIYLKVGAATPNLNCPGYVSGWLQLDLAAPNFKSQYAAALTAKAAGKLVNVYVSGCGYYPYAQNFEF